MNVENMCNVDRELRGGKRAVIVFQRYLSWNMIIRNDRLTNCISDE